MFCVPGHAVLRSQPGRQPDKHRSNYISRGDAEKENAQQGGTEPREPKEGLEVTRASAVPVLEPLF